ncbi:heterokaryon incompatibility protein-domain-containing protein [Annulohypoxylon maeteangense]|uniref:heterokaryon incompatibility protein-domain-containing protein n=1 Tax=Annulohypoxylon maeteangense TaxID=1927788 RepID=UPI002007E295|nr:heterokaryon incompatibility protein-domain-containing protein [Annulohypoxylon maeteangense]KAI0881269.1 heterokaryon incompatibility protein-domain-containing protein [Annulohypoxylon maeteangense]
MRKPAAPDITFEDWIISQQDNNSFEEGDDLLNSPRDEDSTYARAVSPQGSNTSSNSEIEMEAEGLCSQCMRLVNHVDSIRGQSGHNMDIPMRTKLSAMRTSPCDICRIIYRGLDEIMGFNEINDWFFRLTVAVDYFFRVSSRGVKPHKGPGLYKLPDWKCDLYFFTPDGGICPWGLFPTSPLYNITPIGSERFFKRALQFVQQCDLNHSCLPQDKTSLLPTRVVDIGKSGLDDVKLLSTEGRKGRYICLSHCWGGHQPIQTTSQTLEAYSTSLPFQKIPRTYQIAMDFARRLGVRYIWIDSLCIIQDDKDDWSRESANMCDIYENSYLTIAATSSPNCSFDIFKTESRKLADIAGQSATGKPYRVMAVDGLRHPDIDTPHDIMLRDWPLLSRAWVFQERLLSPRILHLTQFEIIWECKDGSMCECGNMPSSSKEHHHTLLETLSGSALAIRWHDMAEWYSKLSITYNSDKLPSLSGLAKQMAKKRPDAKYLAGLWEDSLAVDLLWKRNEYADKPHAPSARITEWIAPSWSWVSLGAPVHFPFGPLVSTGKGVPRPKANWVETFPKLFEIECDLATSDITGKISGGFIKITGRVIQATLNTTLSYDGISKVSRVSLPLEGDESLHAAIKYFNDPMVSGIVDLDYPEDYQGDEQGGQWDVLVVPIARVQRLDESISQVEEVDYSLVLTKIDDQEKYKRIGLAREKRDSGVQRYVDDPAMMWRERPGCFANLGSEKTVTII